MKLWRVVLLVNLSLGVGLLLGFLAWGRQVEVLERKLLLVRQQAALAGVERTWTLRGVVRAVLPDMNVVVLTHEDIPGYMGPMTMGFRVHEPQLYRGLDIGDPVRFTLNGVPPAAPFTDLTGTVVSVKPAGGTPIPPGGAVLVGRGTSAGRLASEAPIGEEVTSRLVLRPQWAGVVDAVGGGPLIVQDGQPVFRALEQFSSSQLSVRNPRTAVGQRADGRIIFMTVDGRQPGYSTGLTNFELAQQMVRLGAVTASSLDAGGSTTMAFDGKLLSRPSDPGGERAVADGLFVFYYGVQAPAPSVQVLSPNGDGVDEVEPLSFKVVRPSTVTASLIGPDRIPRQTTTGFKDPGTYKLAWNGRTDQGSPEPEGRWRWVINAVDDQQQQSRVERLFYLNNTLGFLKVKPARVVLRKRGGSVRVRFRLAHSAQVTLTIRTASGARVRTIRKRLRAGQTSIRWNGRYGNGVRAFSGSYIAQVQTSNAFGPAKLERRFFVRRARR